MVQFAIVTSKNQTETRIGFILSNQIDDPCYITAKCNTWNVDVIFLLALGNPTLITARVTEKQFVV